jgi:hypothetical protein
VRSGIKIELGWRLEFEEEEEEEEEEERKYLEQQGFIRLRCAT